ncbi:MAG: GNAT family N-acetyltransferase [Acidimicrobiales bacterium]|nr:GNAT family N-acetyltransferase [Acidimicrobiales bacterium]
MSGIVIRPATTVDAAACAAIYAPSVRDSAVSFEFEEPDEIELAERIARVQQTDPWLVATIDDLVVGYAYSVAFRAREAYAASRETTVYIDDEHHGRGLGRSLMEALLDYLRERGAHIAIAGIALPNDASVALHESLGFESVGVFREVGRKFDTWHDVGFWQRAL